MKRIIMAILAIAFIFIIAACNKKVEIAQNVKEYEVVRIQPPQHFYVDLKDLETGIVYKSNYVGESCYYWKRLNLGTKWKFTELTYRDNDGKLSYSIRGVYTLCDSLRELSDQ